MKVKNWEKWSSIAEIISSIAILITLVYLSIQTQQNQELLRTQINQAYIEQRITHTNTLFGDSEVSTAFFKVQNGEDLTPLENHKLNRFYTSTLVIWGWEFQQYQNGLHELSLTAWKNTWNTWPGFRNIYNSTSPLSSKEFREFFENNIINQ